MKKAIPTRSLPVEINLTAAIVAVAGGDPAILVANAGRNRGEAALPSGPFDPLSHRTLDIGLRAWVGEQTGVPLGYVEQLYTFGDRGRHAEAQDRKPHVVSVGYLALTRLAHKEEMASGASFRPWYGFFPWEDWRSKKPAMVDGKIVPALHKWAARDPDRPNAYGLTRTDRVRMLFEDDGGRFNDENVLDRYQLLYEAGLVEEARRDGRASPLIDEAGPLGEPMRDDHRRILATAMGRLRAKMKYRPVIFELMPESFTLTALQRTAEALEGRRLHKQNFRRFVENSAVVEATGGTTHSTGGRPAALFRFRREVLQERPAPGLRVGVRA
ncbi:NAD regulator [Roseiarcaceae bacterium H3SJ34-1]|uniref:NUDIX hydrolase n=1 Tax=Terripilifer ovatus TaxID=3032367 RepID=UPI003AB939A0|nr:NAD regulator [Roseiarcaceae bacterium H3SJ34-1]